MASSSLLTKTSVRAAGALTLSGLMVGGVVMAQGADAAPEVQQAAAAAPVASLNTVDAQISYVPAGLARPAVAPKTHEQIQAEKKAAADEAQAKQDAEKKAAAERQKADEAAARKADEEKAQAEAQLKAEQQKAEKAEAQQKAEQQKADEQEQASTEQTASSSAPAAAQGSTGGTGVQNASSHQASRTSDSASSDSSTPVETSGSYDRAAVVAAARAQIGVHQDCTALVTKSLRATGIEFHGWPKDYLSLGHTVSASQAQPGDIIYYASNGFGGSHVAIYLGNGRAIHGGWEGGTTAEFSASLPAASTPIYIHVDR